MPARDEHDSLERRRDDLRRRLAEADRSAAELQTATERSEALEAELAELDARLARRKGRRRLSLLDDIRIASPCTASWDAMTGDDRVRFCGQCEKNVYNLSAMTRAEGDALLAEWEGSICVRLYQRADGTVITSDCPEGVRRRRRRTVLAVAGAGAMAATAAFAAPAQRQPLPVATAQPTVELPRQVATAIPTAVPEVPSTHVVMGAPPPPIQGMPVPRKLGKVTVPKRTLRPANR